MIGFFIRRILQGCIVLLVVTLLAFVMFRYIGDPVTQMVNMDTTAADRERIRNELGLNAPVIMQYLSFLGHAVRGDFGLSYQFKQPVIRLIGESFPATIELVLTSTVVALVLGVCMGIATALNRNAFTTKIFLSVSVFGVAVPTFLIGVALIYIFSVTLGWLPSYGRGETVRIGGWTTGLLTRSGLASLVLPTITLAVYQMALIMRLVRAEMLEVLRSEYIRFARARGIRSSSLYFVHAFRNTLIPVVTIVGLQLGSLIGFSIITEMVFQWPGMGFLFLQAVQSVDIPVMAAYLLIVSMIIIGINVSVDLLYAVIDPRVRSARSK